jgi:hypothetical protein
MFKMKWLLFPVAGVLLYVIWTQGLPLIGVNVPGAAVDMTSARGVAQAYMNAAVGGEYSAIDGLCEPDVVDEAGEVARELHQLEVDRWGVSVKQTQSESDDPDVQVYTSILAGRVAVIELRLEGENWRITSAALD